MSLCVKYRRNRCWHSLMLDAWNATAVQIPPDTLIQPSTAKPLRSQHKSSNLQKKNIFYPSFWISTHPYPSTHSVLSLSILTFCCCFQRRSQQFPTAKSPLSFKAPFTPPSSTCAYMCACVWQSALLEGVLEAHKHVTKVGKQTQILLKCEHHL